MPPRGDSRWPCYTCPMQPIVWSKHLDTVGNGTGTHNAVGNYASTPTEFLLIPAKSVLIYRMLITVEDASGFKAEIYGSGVALTNGIDLEVRDEEDNVQELFTDAHSVKTNSHWAMYCFDVDVKSWRTSGAGDEMLVARWTFSRMGAPLRLREGQKLVIKLNDDFTGLILHHFVAQGTGQVR